MSFSYKLNWFQYNTLIKLANTNILAVVELDFGNMILLDELLDIGLLVDVTNGVSQYVDVDLPHAVYGISRTGMELFQTGHPNSVN